MQVLKSQALNKTHIESSDVSKPLLKQIHVESILEIKYQRECCPAEGWGLGGIGQLGLLNNKLSYLSYLFFSESFLYFRHFMQCVQGAQNSPGKYLSHEHQYQNPNYFSRITYLPYLLTYLLPYLP